MSSLIAQLPLRGVLVVSRAPRVPIGQISTLIADAAVREDILIVNLSQTGCLFRTSLRLISGEVVSISIPNLGLRPVMIRRIDQDKHGAEFLNELAKGDVELARKGIISNAVKRALLPKEADANRLFEIGAGFQQFARGLLRPRH